MATIAGVSLSNPSVFFNSSGFPPNTQNNNIKFSTASPLLNFQGRWPCLTGSGKMDRITHVRAAPDKISEKVEESIKNAQETCADDPASGECVAAWDEVEELSAAASHARDKKKDSDPLEDYCKDNPETKECKTFDD